MKGHIRRPGKRSWAVVLDLGRDGTGKRRQKWHSMQGRLYEDLGELFALKEMRDREQEK